MGKIERAVELGAVAHAFKPVSAGTEACLCRVAGDMNCKLPHKGASVR